jgi:hypothetical protein
VGQQVLGGHQLAELFKVFEGLGDEALQLLACGAVHVWNMRYTRAVQVTAERYEPGHHS